MRAAIVCLMIFGCSETGTGVLLELDGSGMVDAVDVVGMWDGVEQKSGSTMGTPQHLPFTVLIEMPARAVTAKFSVTARLRGVVVGQGVTPDVKVEPHTLANAKVFLGGPEDDLSMPDLAGVDFYGVDFSGEDLSLPEVADLSNLDLSKGDLAMPACSGSSRCGDAGVCNGFESGSIDPPWYTIVRSGCSATIDSTRACRGSKSIHLTLPNSSGMLEAFVFEQALTPTATTYLRGFFYLPANLGFYTLLEQAYQSFGPDYRALTFTGLADGTFRIDNSSVDPPESTGPSAMHLPLNRWVCVEMKIVSNTAGAGTVTTWIDGVQQNDINVTGKTTQPSSAYDTVAFGLSVNAGSTVPAEEIWLDEVMVDTQPIGCFR